MTLVFQNLLDTNCFQESKYLAFRTLNIFHDF